MEINANQLLLSQDAVAKQLVSTLSDSKSELQLEGASVYHRFPLYREGNDGSIVARVLVLSRNHGLVVHECISPENRGAEVDVLSKAALEFEQTFTMIFSKLLRSKLLRASPLQLKYPVVPCYFAPSADAHTWSSLLSTFEAQQVSSVAEVKAFYKKLLLQEPLHLDVVRESMAILEGSKALSKPTERKIDPAAPKNRAAVLNEVETSICTFDLEQKRAALHTLDAAQRIRGLAGSGKTIILAMKAAQIHLQHPDAEILYTFYTKSLYGLIKEQITRFYRSFSDRDPDWTKIHILHAWGGRNLPGVYWSVCRNHGVNSIPFGEAKQFSNPFDHVCELLLKQPLKQMYDYALLDEAQDFPKHFYRLCRAVTKNSRVIWGYDECQNILDVTIQDTKETFGKDDGGKYHLDFSKLPASSLQDLVLHVCYRNPRKVLFCAFAIGLGLYGDRIIQMLENNEHWEDLGFEVSEGNSKTGDTMVIVRPERNSPLVKNQLLESDDVVRVSVCKDLDDESKFVSEQIERDIREGLFPQDILVISLDDRNARTYFSVLATRLRKKGIVSFNSLDAATTSTAFKVQGSVTLTTVYRAKGNEAGSVYIVGVDSVFAERKSIIARNKLFTALTRAKAWVTVSGIGEDAQACANEINKALKSYPELRFKMPDKKSLRMFQRDLEKGQAELNLIERQLGELSQRMGMDVGELIETISKKTTRKK